MLNADDRACRRFRERRIPGRSRHVRVLRRRRRARRGRRVRARTGTRFRVLGRRISRPLLTGRHARIESAGRIAVASVFGIAPERLRDAVRTFARRENARRAFSSTTASRSGTTATTRTPRRRSRCSTSCGTTPARRRIAVLGEMLELGMLPSSCTGDVGSYAAERGVDLLVGVRGSCALTWSMRPRRGGRRTPRIFEDPAEAGDFVRDVARAGRRRPIQRVAGRAGGTGAGKVRGVAHALISCSIEQLYQLRSARSASSDTSPFARRSPA